jgi:hypothetical protein
MKDGKKDDAKIITSEILVIKDNITKENIIVVSPKTGVSNER